MIRIMCTRPRRTRTCRLYREYPVMASGRDDPPVQWTVTGKAGHTGGGLTKVSPRERFTPFPVDNASHIVTYVVTA